ncbi:ribbon-helix-helix protein, CopG family [Streptomyces sp. WMMC500]|uniref:ribbon-helix-helix protein, CopG family n=1 Tax=Streptomyces sp. WMMC500 TaxID=3015154 RepID=UPI00248CD227|nr:ribbon-helix-helix protein, CopG family [Streptomyces sp. WMMC500]WBB64022.1 ribbon-helix-helix protein, CopG family [Streptomyces sp. WMMC500]
MTVQTISFRPDATTRRELDALASMRDVTVSDAIRQAVHEAYVREQYRQAAAEVREWRLDPAYAAELAAVREQMDDLRAW